MNKVIQNAFWFSYLIYDPLKCHTKEITLPH